MPGKFDLDGELMRATFQRLEAIEAAGIESADKIVLDRIMASLRDCLFCGGSDHVPLFFEGDEGVTEWAIECDTCGARGPSHIAFPGDPIGLPARRASADNWNGAGIWAAPDPFEAMTPEPEGEVIPFPKRPSR